MKALFAGATALAMTFGSAVRAEEPKVSLAAAAVAEEKKDSVDFLGTVSEDAWLDHFNESFEAYGPEDEGNGWAIFGVTVKGLYDKQIWYHVSCAELLKDEGKSERESMLDFLTSRETLNILAIFEAHRDVPVDVESMQRSVPAAVSSARDSSF